MRAKCLLSGTENEVEECRVRGPGEASRKSVVSIWILMTFIIRTARDKWDIRLYSCTIYK